MRSALLSCALLLLACAPGPSRVKFEADHCFVDGHAADLTEVEGAQARISARILDRQPIYVGVTIAVILLAGASHIEKLVLLLRARKQEGAGLAERIRAALERYRAHPVRYFAIVATTLALLTVAGSLYIYLDADKRASDRALAQLQFCQLALKTADEQASLDEERKNLVALQGTASDIRALVTDLPPEEQRKAEAILGQMHTALGNQDRLLAKSNAVAAAVQARSEALQRDIQALHGVPEGVKQSLVEIHALDGKLGALDGKVGALDGKVKALAEPLQRIDGRGQPLVDGIAALQQGVKALDAKVGARAPGCADEKLANGKTLGETVRELAERPSCLPCRCEPPAVVRASDRTDGGAR